MYNVSLVVSTTQPVVGTGNGCVSVQAFGTTLLSRVVQPLLPGIRRSYLDIMPSPEEESMIENIQDICRMRTDAEIEELQTADLRTLIPELVKTSTRRKRCNWGQQNQEPTWWPKDVPFNNVRSDTRQNKNGETWLKCCKRIVKAHSDYTASTPLDEETEPTTMPDVPLDEETEPTTMPDVPLDEQTEPTTMPDVPLDEEIGLTTTQCTADEVPMEVESSFDEDIELTTTQCSATADEEIPMVMESEVGTGNMDDIDLLTTMVSDKQRKSEKRRKPTGNMDDIDLLTTMVSDKQRKSERKRKPTQKVLDNNRPKTNADADKENCSNSDTSRKSKRITKKSRRLLEAEQN